MPALIGDVDPVIPEPYFYLTTYPLPDALPSLQLPAGTTWRTEGFIGAMLLYRSLIQQNDPRGYLLTLCNTLITAGREQMNAVKIEDDFNEQT